jgi:hypothetical protein
MALVGQVKVATGVELVKQRYDEAVRIKQRMHAYLRLAEEEGDYTLNGHRDRVRERGRRPETSSTGSVEEDTTGTPADTVAGVRFQWQDMLHPHALDNATHVYAASTCFSGDMLSLLVDRLRESRTVRAVASLVPLPFGDRNRRIYSMGNSRSVELESVGAVHVSWKQRPIAIYFYWLQ